MVWVLVCIVIVAAVFLAVRYLMPSASNSIKTNASSQIKFADSPDAINAYLISTDSYDAKTQTALAGFKVDRKVLADGTQQINLIAQDPTYQSQSYTVQPGQSLYFIEKFLQDDKNGQEKNMGDDSAILVGADGYIIK